MMKILNGKTNSLLPGMTEDSSTCFCQHCLAGYELKLKTDSLNMEQK